MPEGNPLVAKAPTDGDGPGPFTAGNGDYGYAGGIGVAESAMDAFNGVKDGDWVAGGLGMLGLAGEIAGAAIDPFGYLMSSVASFLMEHVQPLKDMLDSLAGDPPVIQSYSETWGNVAKSLEDSQVTYANAVKNGTASWTGAGADAYRESAKEVSEALSGAATVAGGISTVVMIMGEVVSFVREFVRQLIADLVGKLISWVAETVFSLGFGTPVVVAQAVTAIAAWAARITEKLKALVDTIRRVSPLLGKLADVFGKIIKVLGKLAGKVTGLDVISTKNIKTGGFAHRTSGGSGGGGSHGGGPDGEGGSGGDGDGGSGSSGDGDSGSGSSSDGSNSDGSNRGSGGDGADSPSGDGSSGTPGDGSPSRARGDDGSSPSTRDSDGAPNRAGEGSPDNTSSPSGDSASSPSRTTSHRGDSSPGNATPSEAPDSSPDTAAPSHAGDGGAPSHRGDSSPGNGSPNHTGDTSSPSHRGDSSPGNGSPSHAGDSGVPSHRGDNSPGPGAPSHAPNSTPSHAADSSPPAHSGDNSPSRAPETSHNATPASDTGNAPHTTRPGDSTTSASGSAPPATPPRAGDASPSHQPSPRTSDGNPAAAPPGQPVVGGGTPGSPSPGNPGTPGSGGGVPGPRTGGGWTGTPGSPGAHTPRVTTDAPSGPGHGPEGRPRQPNGPGEQRPVARGTDAPPDHAPTHNQPGHLTPDEVNRRHSESTPSGTSYHHNDPDLGDLPHRVAPDPDGRHTVDVHVTPDGHARIGDRLYTPEEFADILRRNGDYDGRPIRLIGCDAGSNDFAKRLSRELDVEVMAPSKPAWTDANGRVFSSDYELGPDGRMRPKIPPNGEWDIHRPDGSTHRASEDGFTPDTHHGDKSDVDADSARDRGDSDSDSGSDRQHGDDDMDVDDPEHDPVPTPRVIDPDSPEFGERFVDWDRPTHDAHGNDRYARDPHPGPPPDPGSPQDIQAPHRDRDPSPPDAPPRPEDVSPVPAPLTGSTPLHPNTAYRVANENGTHSTFFTNDKGEVKWVEAETGAKSHHAPGQPPAGTKSDGSGFNPDLGYPLLPDVQYRVNNFNDASNEWSFHTDDRGQTDSMTGDPSYGKSQGEHRDDRNNFDKDSYSAQGRAGHEGNAAYRDHPDHGDGYDHVKWAGGHLAANESGGPGEYINMFPQMAASNSGHARDGWIHEASWRKQEIELAKFAGQPGQSVENYQVRMVRGDDGVPAEVTMRWQEVSRTVDADGNTVETRVTKERVYPNDPSKVNYGENVPYKNSSPN